MALIILVLVAFIVGIISYYLWIWTYWLRMGIDGPLGYPFVGNLLQSSKENDDDYVHLMKLTKKYGRVYGMTEGVMRTLVISDPKLVHEVFVKQFDNFYGRRLNAAQGDPEKDKKANIFISQGHRWKRLRAISSPTFSNNSLRKIKDTVEDSVFELLKHMEKQTSNGESIDMLLFFQEFTMDVIGRIAMGQNESQMFNNPMMSAVKSVFGPSRKSEFLLGAVFPIAAKIFRKMTFTFKYFGNRPVIQLFNTVTNTVNNRVEQRELIAEKGVESQEPSDFIDLFLNARSEEDFTPETSVDFSKSASKVSRVLSIDEIVSQCVVFLIAGFHTTSLSLAYSSFLLATHPDKMKKLQEEVDRECPDANISFDQLLKLKYMAGFFKGWIFQTTILSFFNLVNSRRCMKSTKIGEYTIEKGTDILVDTWTLHYDKTIWGEDADEFKPERWQNIDEKIRNSVYISFGLGPRVCIGMRLAFMEERLLLAHILKKYTFETGEKTEIPRKLFGRMQAIPGSVNLHLRPRD